MSVSLPTLYVLEEEDNVDPIGRLFAVSIDTGKKKLLYSARQSSRALFFSEDEGLVIVTLFSGPRAFYSFRDRVAISRLNYKTIDLIERRETNFVIMKTRIAARTRARTCRFTLI